MRIFKIASIYASTLTSALTSLLITEVATSKGLADELNPLLEKVLQNPLISRSIVATSITMSFILIGTSSHVLNRLNPGWGKTGCIGYSAVLGLWFADLVHNIVLILSRTEAFSLLIVVPTGGFAFLMASKALIAD